MKANIKLQGGPSRRKFFSKVSSLCLRIFCDSDVDQLLLLRMVLIWLKAVSGLKINRGKSELVPMAVVPNIMLLVDVLGCK